MDENKTNKKNKKKAIIIVVSSIIVLSLIAISIPMSFLLQTDKSVKASKKYYKQNEIEIAKSNTFEKLNNVVYPDGIEPVFANIDDDKISAYNNFSNKTYHSLVNTSKSDNMSYSTVGLYSLINEMVKASSRDDLTDRLNNLLGLDEDARKQFYYDVMNANSFATENMTIQLKNSAFFDNRFDYSPSFVDYLTNLYCEAYQIDFSKEANKMIEWVNKAVNANDFIDKDFLELDDETALYLFSTLYFKGAWQNKYLKESNRDDDFYLSNGDVIKTKYMQHSYTTNQYYDYGSYISFKDYYYGGYASITYLVPKDTKDDIFMLTKDTDIFTENKNNKIENDNGGFITINLSTPKFNSKSDIDFENCLKDLGFADIYDSDIDSFHNAFASGKSDGYNLYVQKVKQRNEVEFNEDGTIVRSVSMASFGAKEAAFFEYDTLDIKLNQPFIYVIKDVNDIPIFVGHIDNPKI